MTYDVGFGDRSLGEQEGLGDGCLEHSDSRECVGPVRLYAALSGSGQAYPRCELGYRDYYDRVQPQMDRIRAAYPDTDTPPDWFDPTVAGERWNEH